MSTNTKPYPHIGCPIWIADYPESPIFFISGTDRVILNFFNGSNAHKAAWDRGICFNNLRDAVDKHAELRGTDAVHDNEHVVILMASERVQHPMGFAVWEDDNDVVDREIKEAGLSFKSIAEAVQFIEDFGKQVLVGATEIYAISPREDALSKDVSIISLYNSNLRCQDDYKNLVGFFCVKDIIPFNLVFRTKKEARKFQRAVRKALKE